jgi:hypothetical protein
MHACEIDARFPLRTSVNFSIRLRQDAIYRGEHELSKADWIPTSYNFTNHEYKADNCQLLQLSRPIATLG